MSVWTLWTWISVAVLIAGSAAVFLWFLRDALFVFRDIGATDEERGGVRSTERHGGG